MATFDDERRNNKRLRETPPEQEDVMRLARIIWRRKNEYQAQATASEDRDFRSTFGCSAAVTLIVWSLLFTMDLVPSGGTLEHLLWTLMFLKVCAKETVLSSLCGADRQTVAKWVWLFLDAIASLEPSLVSIGPRTR